jgi:2-(1,2-epoxy-1,2-dihydrophenyl)acetyl-CoA isomerase
MSDDVVLYTVAEGVATITLNRPGKLNAFTVPMTQGLLRSLKAAARDGDVRAVVLTGAGRAFSAGQDLAELQASGDVSIREHLEQGFNQVILALRGMEKPVIGAINGVAAGAALGMALATDLRIAATEASFLSAFVRIGLVPDSGVSWLLTQLVGPAKALELMLSGEVIPAQQALELGLVSRVVPGEELAGAAQAWAAQLAAGPTRAYGLTKRIAHQAATASLEQTLAYEAMLQEIAARTADHQEGVAAFLSKRHPNFEGR